MAEYEPNPQQKEFLGASQCNVLVSASAGSGKTSTMIQKLVGIIGQEKAPITSLLVVTYTNAAASEIKQKLFNELSKLIATIGSEKDRAFLQEQLENIGNAEIGTLHSICKKLIVKYFYKLSLSPDFGQLSDKEEKYLLDTAVSNVFTRHISKGDDDFFELYDCYNSKRNDIHLKSMCLSLYTHKCAKIGYNQWINDFLNSSYDESLKSNTAGAFLLEHYSNALLQYSSQINRLLSTARGLGLEKYSAFLSARLQFVDEISKAQDFETAVKIVQNQKFPNKPTKSKNASAEEGNFDDDIVIFHKQFGDLIKKFKEDMTSDNVDDIVSNISSAKNNVKKLCDIVDEIEKEYKTLKEGKNVLDFNDLEDKMMELLLDNEVRDTLKKQYGYVFVDEYQDINDKQESILQSMVSGDNYYMIGDVKQSIYAFRQSSPKIFISKYNSFSSDGERNRLINFNANYRSDRNILEFANSVFDSIITRDTIGIDYKSDARFLSKKEYAKCKTTMNIIDTSDGQIEDKEKCECLVIAREILRLVNLNSESGERYKYSDIAIILRQRGTYVKTLAEYLSSMQIPVSTSINSDFFNTAEIQLLISILRVVSNFKDDISMAIVLKALFGVDENELIKIRQIDENAMFFECVQQYNIEDDLLRKINSFFDFVKKAKNLLLGMTINEFLKKVIDEYDILLVFKSMPGGSEKESNILEFLAISDNENYQYNLDKFLDYLDFVSKESNLQHLGSNSDAVQICTIHHSKGLEYPIVILGGMGKAFQVNKDSGNIIISNRFGVGLKSIDSRKRCLNETIIRTACKLDNSKSEIDEEIRLLYVAMTRAKTHLSLVGAYDTSRIPENKRKGIYFSKNYFDLIFKSIENVYLPNFCNKNEFDINENSPNSCHIRILKQDDFEEEDIEKESPIILESIDRSLLDRIQKVYSSRPNTSTTTIKNTVTNILKEETDYENLNYCPKELNQSDRVENRDFLKVGTAYHSVMQELKFSENKAEIKSLISGLITQGKIEKDIAKYIEIDKISRAVEVLKSLIFNAKQVYREKQFLLCENYNKLIKSTDNNTKVIVQGVIDLVVISDSGVYLIDYKTNRGVSAEQLIQEYRLQLQLYAKAFELATGIEVSKCFLYSFHLGKLIEVDFEKI